MRIDAHTRDRNHVHFIADSGVEIIDELLRLHRATPLQSVRLLNYYKEVPISGTADGIRFEDNKIFCRTNEIQARAISLSSNTIANFASLLHDVHAVARYDDETREVVLSGFAAVNVVAGQRESIRVRMHIPHSVVIEAGPNHIRGRLQDLSLAGCAIVIADGGRLGNFTFMTIQLEVPLKTGKEPVRVRVAARLIKVLRENSLTTGIFLFDHDKSSEDQIGKIVAMRQMEIIRELK